VRRFSGNCEVVEGNNFVYVNKEADLDKALFIIINGKRQIFRFAMPWIKF
jgi:gamma-glutamyl phosphate reductase